MGPARAGYNAPGLTNQSPGEKSAMKSFRLSLPDGREATGVGCLLALGSAAAGLAAGVPLAFFVAGAVGVVAIPLAILPSLLLFVAGSAVLEALSIPVWKQDKRPRAKRRPRPPWDDERA
jgi:hypothetical protein